jgi:transposase
MRKAYKYRLSPTKQQEQHLFWTLARCRELYNAALSERRDAYRMAGKSVSYYEQKRALPEIKTEIRPEYQDIHSQVLQDVLLRLNRAFENFFRRVKNGEEPGYPRFQGRNRYNSFTYPQGGYALTHDSRLCLSKIGSIKIKSILDAGWGQFQHIVSCKAAWAGRSVVFVNLRHTSQVCSQCGVVKKKELSERWHSCECGCELDRDTNAAINILRLGRSQRRDAPCVEAPCL